MSGRSHDSRAAIASAQLTQLQALLRTLAPANKFYRDKLGELVTRRVESLEAFSDFPFTTKREIAEDQRQNPPYGTNLTFPIDHYTRCHQTSGTAGNPLRWLDTPQSWGWLADNWREVYEAAGVSRADRIFFAFSFGPFIGFWLAFEAATQIGALCLPGGGLSSSARLRAMLDQEVTILCCTPTYAMRLAEVAAEEGIDLAKHRLRKIIVAGEPGGSIPATRTRIEQLWPGARVFDHHGMTEVGPVTYECPAQPGKLHVIEPAYLAEVLHSDGRPAQPGETGELILTTLGRVGSPLLRYRTGDVVKQALQPSSLDLRPCACGSHRLALDGGILGRTDDMVIVRGVNVFPAAIEEIIRSFSDIAEYRVQVAFNGALAELEVQIEPRSGHVDQESLKAKLEKTFLETFALRVPVVAVASGTLPRFELKAQRWIKISN